MNSEHVARMFKCGSCGAPAENGCPCQARRRIELHAYMLGVSVAEWLSDPERNEESYRRAWEARVGSR